MNLQSGLVLHQSPSYIFVPSTGKKILLPSTASNENEDFSISPDSKLLAYDAQQPNTFGQLFIVGNDGVLKKELSGKEWWNIIGWVDNSHIMVSKFANQNPFSSVILDPLNGNVQEELKPNYPDIYSGGSSIDWGRFSETETVYNSDSSLVIYPTDATTAIPLPKLVLWDLKAGKALNGITDPWHSSSAPLWLSNGKGFVVDVPVTQDIKHTDNEELMEVDADGGVKRLTHLLDSYPDVQIVGLSQSADGRYISFWFLADSGPSKLAIYNTVTESTKVFCVNAGGKIAPVWSPSGHQVLVDGTFDGLDNYGTIFVDVESGVLAQVQKGVIPVGWMSGQ